MKRNRFFIPWAELKQQFRGPNRDVIAALMYIVERLAALLLSLFVVTVPFFQEIRLGEVLLGVVCWLSLLYLGLIILYAIFTRREN